MLGSRFSGDAARSEIIKPGPHHQTHGTSKKYARCLPINVSLCVDTEVPSQTVYL